MTGANGFLGRHVVRALQAQGKQVRGLVRALDDAGGLESVELVEGDVTRPETLGPAVAGADAVIHLVAILQGRPEEFDRVIGDGTRNLVEAAREAGVRRFVHISALGTNDETRETVPYYRGKWTAEQAVLSSGV